MVEFIKANDEIRKDPNRTFVYLLLKMHKMWVRGYEIESEINVEGVFSSYEKAMNEFLTKVNYDTHLVSFKILEKEVK